MLPLTAHHTSGSGRCARLAGPTLTFFAAGGGPLGLNAGQQGGGAMVATDQLRIGGAPVGGQLAAKRLGQNGLGQVIDPRFGRLGLLLDGIGIGKELFYATDNFGS